MPKWLDRLLGVQVRKPMLPKKTGPEPRLVHILEGEAARERQTSQLIRELRRIEGELGRSGQ